MTGLWRVLAGVDSERVARWCVVLAAAGTVVYGLAIMGMKIVMPAQIDVWEGKLLCEAYVLSTGQQIYRDPAQFGNTSYYTPLFQLILSFLLRYASPSFALGRTLTAVAFVGASLALVGLVTRARGPRTLSGDEPQAPRSVELQTTWLVVLVIAAMFTSIQWGTVWYGVMTKSDALCCAFWVAGWTCILKGRPWSVAAGGALVALAYFAKQTAVFVLPGILLFLWTVRRRDAVLFTSAFVGSWVVLFLILKEVAGDWMWFYTTGVPSATTGMEVFRKELVDVFFFLRSFPLIILATALAVVLWREHIRIPAYRLALCSFPFLLASGCWTSSVAFANVNSLMPLFYCCIVLGGYGVSALLVSGEKRIALWLIFVLLVFEFDRSWPYEISKARGRFDQDFTQVVEFLRAHPGSAYAPTHNVFTLLAGKPFLFDDRLLARDIAIAWKESNAMERIARRMNSGEFEWLVLDKPNNDLALFDAEGLGRYEKAADFGTWTIMRLRQGDRERSL